LSTAKAAALLQGSPDTSLIDVRADRKFYQLQGKTGVVDRQKLEQNVQFAQMGQQKTVTVSGSKTFAETRQQFLDQHGRMNPLGLSAPVRKVALGAAVAGVVVAGLIAGLPLVAGASAISAASVMVSDVCSSS
jgi:hypothetical protein